MAYFDLWMGMAFGSAAAHLSNGDWIAAAGSFGLLSGVAFGIRWYAAPVVEGRDG